jgi:anaerobic magnesium-protoporphyrin IX monomethyl ester cyclase
MRVLLTTLNAKYIHSNLAIRLLYGLNRDHEGLDWKEFTIKENPESIAAECAAYDVVAFSCYIWNITPTLAVCRKIKALNPSVYILLGGPEVSYETEPVLDRPEVDGVIVGEGENAFSAFLANYPQVESVPGLLFKRDGRIVRNPAPEPFDVAGLQHINPYAFDEPETLQHRVLYLETSRGCPYKCAFCLASLDNKVRYLPMDRIRANLLYLMEHGRTIKFLDRTFNVKKDFTLEVFRFILDHHRPGNVFQFEITADILHPDIIRFIREEVPHGLFRFEIGIQTVNTAANLAVQRKQQFEKTRAVIEQVRDKVDLHLDLIVGLPLDHWADIRHSVDAVFALFPPELQLGFLKFLKGTPMRTGTEQHGYVYDPEPPYQIIESKYLSSEELQAITRMEFALEAYWNKPRLARTLRYAAQQGSAFDVMLGLGEHFLAHYPATGYTLLQLYKAAEDHLRKAYDADPVLMALLCIDYLMQHRIKPGMLGLQEIPRAEKRAWLQAEGLDEQKFRYLLAALPFDLGLYLETKQIVPGQSMLCVEYDGVQTPRIRLPKHRYSAVQNDTD